MPSSPPVGASSEQPLPLPALTLRFLSGPLAGQELTLGPEGGDLGRALENAVPIPDQALSRRHARISYQDGAWFIEDLGSTNGTSLDQVRLSAPARLEKGSVIRLGANRVEVTTL